MTTTASKKGMAMWGRLNNQHRRSARILLVTGVYSLVLGMSLWLAYLLRFEFSIPQLEKSSVVNHLLWIVPVELAVLLFIGQCAGLLSYFSLPDLRRLFVGLAASSLLFFAIWHLDRIDVLPPRSVLLGNFIFAFGGLCSTRLAFRFIRERFFSLHGKPRQNYRRIGIIGAGDAGAALARELIRKRGLGMQPVAFFDDDRGKWRSHVHNIPVVGAPELLAGGASNLKLDELVIAMPSAPARRIKEIVKLLQKSRRVFRTVPAMDQLATGRVSVSHLRPVEIEDLLGRQPVRLERQNIEHYLHDKVVMVTGAGGSIGSELCRQVAEFKPARLLLLDQSEVQLFQIEQELVETGKGALIKPLIADIADADRMHQIFRSCQPQVIFHAAAHKHVPMMESQPTEAIKNNVFGTVQVSQMAVEYGAERFVMISTDKAVNPTNVMGATKRLAELHIQALAGRPAKTRLMAVRFGNVLGSSGSVIPTFKRQIAAGGPVKVTHPQITRYFMTIPEAVSLVLQSGALGKGGEIFVLDMGKPIRIADLAKQIIGLSGLKVGEDIEIQYTGLRPGEKLYEELQYKAENLAPTDHPKILRFVSKSQPPEGLFDQLMKLHKHLHQMESNQIKLMIQSIVPEYAPYLEGENHPPVPAPLKGDASSRPSETVGHRLAPAAARPA